MSVYTLYDWASERDVCAHSLKFLLEMDGVALAWPVDHETLYKQVVNFTMHHKPPRLGLEALLLLQEAFDLQS